MSNQNIEMRCRKSETDVFFSDISRTTGTKEMQGNNRSIAEITQEVLGIKAPLLKY